MTQITTRTNAGKVYIAGKKFADGLDPTVGDALEEDMPDVAKAAAGGYPDGSFSGYNVAYRGDYERTGIYGGSQNWERNGLSYTISNDAPYSKYVGGDANGAGQAYMHMGRWPIQRRVIENHMHDVAPGIVEDKIDILASTTIGSIGGMY